jgi:hypothetical protein
VCGLAASNRSAPDPCRASLDPLLRDGHPGKATGRTSEEQEALENFEANTPGVIQSQRSNRHRIRSRPCADRDRSGGHSQGWLDRSVFWAKRRLDAWISCRTTLLASMFSLEPAISESRAQRAPVLVPTNGSVVFVGTRSSRHDRLAATVIELMDDTVTSGTSGRCRLWEESGRLMAIDHGSDNGTWLVTGDGSNRISSTAPTVVPAGTRIQIGRQQFWIRTDCDIVGLDQ